VDIIVQYIFKSAGKFGSFGFAKGRLCVLGQNQMCQMWEGKLF